MGENADRAWSAEQAVAWEGFLELGRQLRRAADELLGPVDDLTVSTLGIMGRLARADGGRSARPEDDRGGGHGTRGDPGSRFTIAFENAIGEDYVTEKSSIRFARAGAGLSTVRRTSQASRRASAATSTRGVPGPVRARAVPRRDDRRESGQYHEWRQRPLSPEFTRRWSTCRPRARAPLGATHRPWSPGAPAAARPLTRVGGGPRGRRQISSASAACSNWSSRTYTT